MLDLGCGTGCLAILLTGRGIAVVGVDPAAASLEVARGKPGADRVRWVHGDATAVPLEESLHQAGLTVVEVRDAPDRPGREHVVTARR